MTIFIQMVYEILSIVFSHTQTMRKETCFQVQVDELSGAASLGFVLGIFHDYFTLSSGAVSRDGNT